MTQTAEEKRAYNRARYQRERDKILAQQRERYERDREEILTQNQEYYQANKERIKERASQQYWDDPEEKRKYIADRLRDAKIKAVMTLGGKCQNCGWAEHPAGLQFHHRNPKEKVFNITTNNLTSPKKIPWEMVLEELAKCDLLCANCHFIEESAWDLEGVWPVG